jgi:hypothetical protein
LFLLPGGRPRGIVQFVLNNCRSLRFFRGEFLASLLFTTFGRRNILTVSVHARWRHQRTFR